MKELKELNLSEKEKKDFKWWLDSGLKEIYDYQENWKFVTDTSKKFTNPKVCCICGKPIKKIIKYKESSYCNKHYENMLYKGLIPKHNRRHPNEIRIYEGYCSILTKSNNGSITGEFFIDEESLLQVIKQHWRINTKTGYCVTHGATGYLHTFLLKAENGEIIDHIDRNKVNNRLSNLRSVPQRFNNINYTIQKNNTTGFIGLTYLKASNKYVVKINIDGVNKNIGSYSPIEEALKVRLNAEVKYYGKYSPQKHLFKEYGIDDSHILYDEDIIYKRPCDMFLKKALEIYKMYIK
ncbi:MAG: HNH endonuclease [Candidatus Woesearchaeota archaeon]|jgi:hypothetical protein|nr:HNH endonuclease [Candidatus Woesearchaeota archaeon]